MADPTIIQSVPPKGTDEPIPDVPAPEDPPRNPDPMTADHSAAMYGDATFDTSYPTDYGLLMLPVGRDGAPCIKVRRCNETGMKIVIWSVSRWFEKPKIPSPNTQDPNEVLLRATVYPANPLQTRNGLLWRISGQYEYGLYRPKLIGNAGTKYPVGVPSAEVAEPASRFYDNSDVDPKPLNASEILDSTPTLRQVIQ